jgi:hypothetical protein
LRLNGILGFARYCRSCGEPDGGGHLPRSLITVLPNVVMPPCASGHRRKRRWPFFRLSRGSRALPDGGARPFVRPLPQGVLQSSRSRVIYGPSASAKSGAWEAVVAGACARKAASGSRSGRRRPLSSCGACLPRRHEQEPRPPCGDPKTRPLRQPSAHHKTSPRRAPMGKRLMTQAEPGQSVLVAELAPNRHGTTLWPCCRCDVASLHRGGRRGRRM